MNIKLLSSLSLGKKLVGGFLIASSITALVGGVGFFRISGTITQTRQMIEEGIYLLKATEKLEIQALQHRRYEKDFFLNIGNREKQKEYLKHFRTVSDETEKLISDIIAIIKKNPDLPREMEKVAEDAESSYMKYHTAFLDLTEKVLSDQNLTPQKANSLMVPFKSNIYQFETSVEKLLQSAIEEVSKVSGEIIESGIRSRIIILVILVVSVLISILLGILLKIIITAPVKETARFAGKMAKGDLTHQIEVRNSDEIGSMCESMNQMCTDLKEIFIEMIGTSKTLTQHSSDLLRVSGNIADNADKTAVRSVSVAASVEEMSTNMNSVASAAEETSTSIQIIVSATEEMSSTIHEIAENTANGSNITQAAVKSAQVVTEKIEELERATREINNVTDTIAQISGQTNLLALNATIEAARAGEAGRGFAVVAEEIKVLANQAATATKEINNRIADVQKTTAGSIDAVESIVKFINDINDIVSTVATAIEEQSITTQEISNNVAQAAAGVQEVNLNISQMSMVTAEAASNISDVSRVADETNNSSREVGACAGKLSSIAVKLDEMLSRFRV